MVYQSSHARGSREDSLVKFGSTLLGDEPPEINTVDIDWLGANSHNLFGGWCNILNQAWCWKQVKRTWEKWRYFFVPSFPSPSLLPCFSGSWSASIFTQHPWLVDWLFDLREFDMDVMGSQQETRFPFLFQNFFQHIFYRCNAKSAISNIDCAMRRASLGELLNWMPIK